jgi:hypothetical protein
MAGNANHLLQLANLFADIAHDEILFKVSSFLCYAPRFKDDILLVQASNWPADEAPLFLPPSVAIVLSHLCDIDLDHINTLWSYLRDMVWGFMQRAKIVEERFEGYKKDLGFCN